MVRGVFVSWAGRLCQLGLCVSCVCAVLGSLTAQKLWGVPTPTGHGCSMATSLHEADDTQAACPPQPPPHINAFRDKNTRAPQAIPSQLGHHGGGGRPPAEGAPAPLGRADRRRTVRAEGERAGAGAETAVTAPATASRSASLLQGDWR
jgi:hypothetical protein